MHGYRSIYVNHSTDQIYGCPLWYTVGQNKSIHKIACCLVTKSKKTKVLWLLHLVLNEVVALLKFIIHIKCYFIIV